MSWRGWTLLVTALLIGAAIGVGSFTFVYAKGYSYLSNDPATCANCHIMDEHYAAWVKSSHRLAATCNDCHTPHDFAGKWMVKGKNGFWHSFYFTTGNFPYPLRITPPNHQVVEGACRNCHERITGFVDHASHASGGRAEALHCTRCHRYVGHWVR
ncbi:MAG TPA: cytochrome c nitrite reductase small subunit [Thermoanaerobaculia bacterium]|nr:cytochrome c nitrite reductase small subunit [Thermoanaerobaculia bacterium]